MKTIRRSRVAILAYSALVLASLLGAGQASASEILLNGGFESGSLGPWFQGNDFGSAENWNVTLTTPHTGTFSATDVGNKELRQNFAAVATSLITSISFWAKHAPSSVTLLAYDFYYSDNTSNEFYVNTTGLDWNFFNVTAQLAVGKSLVGFSMYGNSGGRTWIDDASIMTVTEVPVPGSLAVLFSGVLVITPVVYLRNRRNRKAIAGI